MWYLLLEEVLLLFSVYPGLQLLSPLVAVGDILMDEFEDSFGEVEKFLDGVVLDLTIKTKTNSNFVDSKITNNVSAHSSTSSWGTGGNTFVFTN